mmetsp:Transcript_65681/g.182791  ORF Transcript_65681/g.182791 Transcript_65681/m.182791 type:complete len:128 (+) Transcript_65681:68-451(+)
MADTVGTLVPCEAASPPRPTIRLEVRCETKHGESVGICGVDPALGAWDVDAAWHLETNPGAYPIWSSEVPVPAAGTEFKFFIKAASVDGDDFYWESLPGNRTWPRAGIPPGCLVKADFGESGIKVFT